MLRSAKRRVLAALFDKGEGVIDGVLGGIKYNDEDLTDLIGYRPELAGSPEKFFKILDKIKKSRNQETAVRGGVITLCDVGKHVLVVPFVNALGKRTFKSDRLKEEAIQQAFNEGAVKGNQDIVGIYYEHPAITSEEYAYGLYWSWNGAKPNQIFLFLLKQADQGDLGAVKKEFVDKEYEKFRQAVGKVPNPVPPAGSRHFRPIERTIIARNVLKALGHDGLIHATIDIITGYAITDDLPSMIMKVLARLTDPGIPPVISAIIVGYIDGADMIAGGKEQS